MKNLVTILVIFCLFIAFPLGCGDDDVDVCQEGSTAPCVCEGGSVGVQSCVSGQWEECDCTGGGDSDTDSDTDTDTSPGDSIPIVSVSANPTSGTAALEVAFEATVSGGNGELTYAWDFGDDGTAAVEDTSHTYASGGTYTASLVVTDIDGDQGMDSVTIQVTSDATLTVEIAASPAAGVEPLLVEFDAEVVGGNAPFTYAWDFNGDDTVDSAIVEPNHTFAAGVHEVSVTVTDADGDTATDTAPVMVAAVNDVPEPIGEILNGGECAVPDFTRVELNAIPSEDMDDEIKFQWVFVTVPEGSDVDFSNSEIANPWFMPDVEGEYTFRVFVADSTHVVGSDLLTVLATRVVGGIEAVSGAGQEAQTGQAFELPLVAMVVNTCGAALPWAMVRLFGHNARLDWIANENQDRQEWGLTNEEGIITFGAEAGPRVGEGTMVAAALCYEAAFVNDVLVGDAEYLVMDDYTAHPTVSKTVGTTLSFQLTDEYLNPVTGPKTQFDLSVDNKDACWEEPDDDDDIICESTSRDNLVTDANGKATAVLRSITTYPLAINFNDVEVIEGEHIGDKLTGLVRRQWKDDLEGDFNWEAFGQWEHGSPAAGVGPSAAHSGDNLVGTNLDGNYTINEDWGMITRQSGEPDWLFWPIEMEPWYWETMPFAVFLDYWHWYDTIGDTCPECVAGTGYLYDYMYPWGGYPGPDLCWGDDMGETKGADTRQYMWGYAGKSNGWKLSSYYYNFYRFAESRQLSDDDYTMYLEFDFLTSPYGEPDGAGWYIDDVEFNVVWTMAYIQFEAGPPDYVDVWEQTEGGVPLNGEDGEPETIDGGPDSGCASYGENVIIGIETYDEFGNFIDRAGVAVDCTLEDDIEIGKRAANDSATFVTPAYEGTLVSGAGTPSAKATTSDDGEIYLGIQNTEQEWVGVNCDLDALTDDESDYTEFYFGSDHFPPGDCCYNPIVMDEWDKEDYYVWGYTDDSYLERCAQLSEYHELIPEEDIICSDETEQDVVFKIIDVPQDGLYWIHVDGDYYNEFYVNVYQGNTCPGDVLPQGTINDDCFWEEKDIWAYLRKDTTYWIVVRAESDSIYGGYCLEAYVGYEWTDDPQGSGS
jgi:PKD repeat protein